MQRRLRLQVVDLSVAPMLVVRHIIRSGEERALQVEHQAILSVEQLAGIARLFDRERILVDDHIIASGPEEMASIEASDGAGCRIDVDDTGPGIPASECEKIFEPFYRVEGSRAAGTGIGLATVRRILDARGGRVEVEPAEGEGSCFHPWLQRIPEMEPA